MIVHSSAGEPRTANRELPRLRSLTLLACGAGLLLRGEWSKAAERHREIEDLTMDIWWFMEKSILWFMVTYGEIYLVIYGDLWWNLWWFMVICGEIYGLK